ncbi:MAG: coaBC [Devosia sp.]|uniref:hypothetical protein n=1 Tax=Devosia sp. TaxID=1871048 RepID=UPI002A65CC09|nr:coaBC [Devosia sp.]MDB5587297.1 coaBC [Devosia sp.]
MATAALRLLPQVQGVIASAAVMDYRVVLDMVPSVDVLGAPREAARGQWFFGFAALREVAALSAAETLQTGKSGRRPFKVA